MPNYKKNINVLDKFDLKMVHYFLHQNLSAVACVF